MTNVDLIKREGRMSEKNKDGVCSEEKQNLSELKKRFTRDEVRDRIVVVN